jgi:hypothetical protein
MKVSVVNIMHGSKQMRFLPILCVVLILHGCLGTYSLVEFEVLEPATLQFPAHVSQPLVLNRLPESQRIFDEEEAEKLSDEQLLILDTLVSNNVFRGLYDVLHKSPLNNFYWPMWSTERQPELMVKNDIILTKKEVSDLCTKNYSDVILSLEAFHLGIQGQEYTKLAGTYFYKIQLISKSSWYVYLPQSPKPYNEFEQIDTVSYIARKDIKSKRPFPSGTMIQTASYKSGASYGRHVSPVWKRTERNMYTGQNSLLRKGSKRTEEGDWEQAYELWDELAHKGRSRNRAKAYYNMAIYYELEDKLDSASYLIDSAFTCKALELIESYKEELDTRQQKKTKIIKQVERSQNDVIFD